MAGSVLFPDYEAGLSAISSFGRGKEIELMQVNALIDVCSLGYKDMAREFSEKANVSKGVKKYFYKVAEKVNNRRYRKSLSKIEFLLNGHEFEQRTVLRFLDKFKEEGYEVPEQIQNKMCEVGLNIDLNDEIAWEESLKSYYYRNRQPSN